jgi:hypothetical protein
MTICAKAIRLVSYLSATFILYQPVLGYAESNQTEQQHAQAMQLGIFLGGSATQYDVCVAKGYIPPSPKKAEDDVVSYLKTSEQFTHDQEGIGFVQKGWDIAKQKITEQPPKYWESNCDFIGKQWNKYVEMLKLR